MRGKFLLLIALSGLLLSGSRIPAEDKEKAKADPRAVAQARKTVTMLDDVYKTAVVLITDKYVNTKKDLPAGRAAIALFAAVSKKGHHQVRLIDVSGEPYSAKNVAEDDFEKEGVKQIKAGKTYYDKVVSDNGKTYLRAITAIPVVMDKCVMCHPNYKNVKKGEAIGALTYKIPVE